MLQQFDYLKSTSGTVELVNVEVTSSRVLCGFAFIEAWSQSDLSFLDDRGNSFAIVLPDELCNQPNAIAISSENDDIFFAIKDASADH